MNNSFSLRLFAESLVDSGREFSTLETLVYNIAALLASVAAGFDVRTANTTGVHPRALM